MGRRVSEKIHVGYKTTKCTTIMADYEKQESHNNPDS